MSALITPLAVALGAALGAVLRLLIGSRYDAEVPWGTLGVNVVGSGVLGLAAGLGLHGDTLALVGTGFCGGLTTYSSFAVQSVGLGPRRGAGYAAASLALGLLAASLGYIVGRPLGS
ncbi:CrcB family protein [Nocardioides sp.]|uniref:fluoride efflux transporter FluC n=1 Tax=Nocardioides sp. TaxID=35761 RepID=UPI003514BF08